MRSQLGYIVCEGPSVGVLSELMFGVLGVSYFLRNVNDSSSFLFDGFEGPCCYCDVIGLLEWVECKYYGN